jgi:hypothetical protein
LTPLLKSKQGIGTGWIYLERKWRKFNSEHTIKVVGNNIKES